MIRWLCKPFYIILTYFKWKSNGSRTVGMGKVVGKTSGGLVVMDSWACVDLLYFASVFLFSGSFELYDFPETSASFSPTNICWVLLISKLVMLSHTRGGTWPNEQVSVRNWIKSKVSIDFFLDNDMNCWEMGWWGFPTLTRSRCLLARLLFACCLHVLVWKRVRFHCENL